MDKLLLNIGEYLEHIKREYCANISIHFKGEFFQGIPTAALALIEKYNIHSNPYCTFVKRKNHKGCIAHQAGLIKRCAEGGFCAGCFAGVLEYIYPIKKGGNAIGYVCVSGYRAEKPPQNTDQKLWESALSSSAVPKTLFGAVIPPLAIMLENLAEKCKEVPPDEFNMIIQFLSEYHSSITLDDLCTHFGRSKSYISHLFKKRSGLTIKSYCNNLKLSDAKKLLKETNLPVTEIAFNVGFNDTSYFIHLFRKKYGISPLKYRKN